MSATMIAAGKRINGVEQRVYVLQTVCAWCQQERGEQAQSGQSHGICARHDGVMRQQMAEMRARRQQEGQ